MKVFTTGQVAKICKVAPRTVSKWFDSGRLKGYRIPGSQDRRIPREYLIRFLKEHGITNYAPNPFFPVNTLAIMRGAVFAQREGFFERYVDAVYGHMWAQPKKMDEPEVIAAALKESGLDAEAILAGTQQPEVKQQLIANVDDAVARGVFGSPSFFVGTELYFGKDRLRDVEEEIERQKKGAGR